MTWLSKFKNPRTMEGKITRSRRLLLYWWKFKGRQKISGLKSIWQLQNPGSMKKFPGHQEGFRFKIWFKRHLSPIKRWSSQISGLKSGSRDVSLTEALNIRFTIRFKGNISPTKLWSSQISGLKFRLKKNIFSRKSSCSQEKLKGPKRVCCKGTTQT